MTGCWALLVAAGSGRRMGLGRNKVLEELEGKTILERSVKAFEHLVDGVCLVIRAEDEEEIRRLNLDVRISYGGATRQDSVLSGLNALPEEAKYVLVHDAARPLVTKEIIERCKVSVMERGSGVAAVEVKDTIKVAQADGKVISTPERSTLRAIQTPQAFEKEALKKAIESLMEKNVSATDDAGAMESAGHEVYLVAGDVENIKITTPEDLIVAQQILLRRGEKEREGMNRIGHGFDVHRLVPERKLILCGVDIPYEKGLLGHSDADVALHALMDALLGAASLKDIGTHFPDKDPQYKGISSMLLLEKVRELLESKGYCVENVDITILAQRPKLKPYIDQMQENVAMALGIEKDRASVKATTTEGLGFEGEGLGISAHAVALIRG